MYFTVTNINETIYTYFFPSILYHFNISKMVLPLQELMKVSQSVGQTKLYQGPRGNASP